MVYILPGLIAGLTIGYNDSNKLIIDELESDKWTCPYDNLIGDGFCDDEANDFACDFDGGDCCGNDVNTTHCVDCLCITNTTDSEIGKSVEVFSYHIKNGDESFLRDHAATIFNICCTEFFTI